MANTAVKVKNLQYIYPNAAHPALDNVSLKINDQDFVAIVGQTGSGKSTLVSLIDGLLRPTAGQLEIDGINIDATTKPEALSKIHHHVGFVFQFPEQQLFAETVEEDIAFGPHNLGWTDEQVRAAVDQALAMVHLPANIKRHSPFALSGGQMRRVAIAGVLAMRPRILILDEPTAGLDTAASQTLLELVKQLNAQGTTIIMVTHQMEQVAAYANRVLAMHQGQIIMDTSPAQLFSQPAALARLSLNLPVSVDIAQDLGKQGFNLAKLPLSLPELADELAARMRRKTDE